MKMHSRRIPLFYRTLIGLFLLSTGWTAVYVGTSQDIYAGFAWFYQFAFYVLLLLMAVAYTAVIASKRPNTGKSVSRKILRVFFGSITVGAFVTTAYFMVFWYYQAASFGFAFFGVMSALLLTPTILVIFRNTKTTKIISMIVTLAYLVIVAVLYPNTTNTIIV